MSDAATLPDFNRMWDYQNPAATEAKFVELLAAAEKSGDRSYRRQLLTQIARTQGLQGKFDQAHATLDGIERELKDENDPPARVRYLLERGRVLNSSGRTAEALSPFMEAVTVGREARLSRYEIDAIHMVAIVEATPERRIEWGRKGVERAKELNEIGWLHALYNNLGEEYRALKQYDKALECFRAVIESNKQAGKPVDRYARVDEAKMLRLLGEPSQSLENMKQLGAADDGFVSEELGEALLAMGRADDARPYLASAYEKLKDVVWLKKSEPDRLERLRKLAEVR
ncbi:MAG TPA: tetratricopeptide repeat protein [Tepidisphaeraceae bacterium]|jgi:tetratricopeptide (TPR) repeat protein